MLTGDLVLVVLIVIGLIGRSHVLTTAACFLLILKLSHLERYFPTLERRGLELGLLFLMIAVLVPLVDGTLTVSDLARVFVSPAGIAAMIGGLLATYLNGQGLHLLRQDPSLMIGLVLGSIFGIVFLRGIPVGPLMAAAIAAILVEIWQWLRFLSR
ncbi:DUF441 domain-containing protein [Kyrpidia spormannii]|uniref:Uncharacterized protein n=2 Tax=Kyrpidia spormannii TaxID=2055160 RepID=A0ACA8Z8A1_9BACL|nr:DUF441 domain-containing protein [Kyrpidia spormannii]CAB3391956.1 conserved membrane protein of unknown function [Kyrpidia spormannii]CAB3392873.1 conserved membrane protein of unknown function [Kyrpidia spormannii]